MESKKKYNYSRKKKEKKSNISLFDKRIIFVSGEIDDSLAKTIIGDLIKLDLQSHKEIKMYINSPGGSVSSGLAIVDTMNMIKSPISTVCIGKCLSMGCILLVNGSKGRRFITRNSEVMFHEVSSLTYGSYSKMNDDLLHTKSVNLKLCKIISARTNITLKEIRRRTTKKDTWITPKNAIKL